MVSAAEHRVKCPGFVNMLKELWFLCKPNIFLLTEYQHSKETPAQGIKLPHE
jgi:hypothetical protein